MKKCSKCGKPRNHNNSLISLCKSCAYDNISKDKKQLKINQVSKTNKNTPAKFTMKTKAEILKRDKSCIFCGSGIQDIHHVYFSNQANRGENRNDINQGVGLCRMCHDEVHSCKSGVGKRQEAIDYLTNL